MDDVRVDPIDPPEHSKKGDKKTGGTKLYELRSCGKVSVLTGGKHGSKKPKNRAPGVSNKEYT